MFIKDKTSAKNCCCKRMPEPD